jgi:hypothetical protein
MSKNPEFYADLRSEGIFQKEVDLEHFLGKTCSSGLSFFGAFFLKSLAAT